MLRGRVIERRLGRFRCIRRLLGFACFTGLDNREVGWIGWGRLRATRSVRLVRRTSRRVGGGCCRWESTSGRFAGTYSAGLLCVKRRIRLVLVGWFLVVARSCVDGLPVLQDTVCFVRDVWAGSVWLTEEEAVVDFFDLFGVTVSGVFDDLADFEFGFEMDAAEVWADPWLAAFGEDEMIILAILKVFMEFLVMAVAVFVSVNAVLAGHWVYSAHLHFPSPPQQ